MGPGDSGCGPRPTTGCSGPSAGAARNERLWVLQDGSGNSFEVIVRPMRSAQRQNDTAEADGEPSPLPTGGGWGEQSVSESAAPEGQPSNTSGSPGLPDVGAGDCDTTQTDALDGAEGDGKRVGPGRLVCQVAGCCADLTGLKDYHQRYKICTYHLKVNSIVVKDRVQRFCQQCGRFHDVTEFDADKRSCRAQLQRHNARRRKKGHEAALQLQGLAKKQHILMQQHVTGAHSLAPHQHGDGIAQFSLASDGHPYSSMHGLSAGLQQADPGLNARGLAGMHQALEWLQGGLNPRPAVANAPSGANVDINALAAALLSASAQPNQASRPLHHEPLHAGSSVASGNDLCRGACNDLAGLLARQPGVTHALLPQPPPATAFGLGSVQQALAGGAASEEGLQAALQLRLQLANAAAPPPLRHGGSGSGQSADNVYLQAALNSEGAGGALQEAMKLVQAHNNASRHAAEEEALMRARLELASRQPEQLPLGVQEWLAQRLVATPPGLRPAPAWGGQGAGHGAAAGGRRGGVEQLLSTDGGMDRGFNQTSYGAYMLNGN